MIFAPWLRDVLLPLTVTLMAGLVALSLVGAAETVLRGWDGSYVILATMVAAAEAHYSHRLLQLRPLRGGDRARFRAIELAMLFLLAKLATYASAGLQSALAEIRRWPDDPLAIVGDPSALVAFVVAVVAWDAAGRTSTDLDEVALPARLYSEEGPMSDLTRRRLGAAVAASLRQAGAYGSVAPLERLTERFFWGGGLLLLATGLQRIGIAGLLNLNSPPVPGLVLGVLVYFLLGFVVLGLVRYAALRKQWLIEEIEVAPGLGRQWVRYSLALIGLALLFAFVLPTGYTTGLLAWLGWLANVLGAVMTLIVVVLYFLITFPIAWLIARMMGEAPPTAGVAGAPTLPPLPPDAPGGGPGWLEAVRLLLFWSVLLGTLFYIVRAYLQDHPELQAALRSAAPVRWLVAWWRALWRWGRRAVAAVRAQLPARLAASFGRRAAPSPRRGRRPRNARERLFATYLDLLGAAERHGHPRQVAQTPDEFRDGLEPVVPQAEQALRGLTRDFETARYSRTPITEGDAARARSEAEQVEEALRAREGR